MDYQESIRLAMQKTSILKEPDRRIDTFGDTKFAFTILSESIDTVDEVHIRVGEVEAQKPQILTPNHYSDFDVQGFNQEIKEMLNWMQQENALPVMLRYGFSFKRVDLSTTLVKGPIAQVREQALTAAEKDANPIMAIIESPDDAFEIALMRFAIDMISKSQSINAFDLKRKGLI